MSKRKKRKNKRVNKTNPNKLTPQQLELQAEQALSSQHYKVAIQHLKTLLKKAGESDSTLALLRQAYRGRAEELVGVGMTKEAVAIWDIAVKYGLDPIDPRYLEWIVCSHQTHRLLKIYQQLDKDKKRDLQPQLAALCLSGDVSVLKKIAEDDPIHVGYQVANDLLQAWCAGESAQQLREGLKAISFRSPYRDLRQIIQAWLMLEESPDKVTMSIARIAKNSPFYPLAEQVLLAELEVSAFLETLPSLSIDAKNCALEIRDWADDNTSILLEKLTQLESQSTVNFLSKILLGLSKQLPEDYLTPEKRHWLYNATKKVWAISGVISYEKLVVSVGVLSPLKRSFYACLSMINKQENIHFMSVKVEVYLRELKDDPTDEVGEQDKLIISSLLNRYLFEEWKYFNQNKITEKSVNYLRQLLSDDPSDDASWVELLDYRLQQGELKPARDDLKNALAHHPDHIKLLDLAVRIAIAGNAFVKAAAYAKRILAVDPINSSAQQHLQHAHLSHARKQIKQKKWHLVSKELEKAEQWQSTPLTALLIEVVKAYQIQAEKGVKVATEAFQSLAKKKPMDEVALDFIIRHQGEQLNLAYKTALKSAKLTTFWDKPSKDKVLALIDIVQPLRALDTKSIKKPLSSLLSPLKKAAKLAFSAKEGEQLCEFLMQVEEEGLLQQYSNQLRKKFKDKPIFVYYYFVNQKDFFLGGNELEDAWEIAKEQGDDAVTALLVGLLQKCSYPFGNPFSGGNMFFDDEDDEDEDDEDGAWDIFDDMPDGIPAFEELEEMMSAMEKMAQLDDDDVDDFEKASILADIIPVIPLKDVLSMAENMLDKKSIKLLLNTLGDKGLRTFCQQCLKGEKPEDVFTKMLSNKINLPLSGGVF